MTQPMFQGIPIFRIFDVEKAKDFYVGFLGFRVDWEHRFDHVPTQLRRSGFRQRLSASVSAPSTAWRFLQGARPC
jgi:catechol 2,3-dioxygenase-like lactoylglutathione lyase family enzyme